MVFVGDAIEFGQDSGLPFHLLSLTISCRNIQGHREQWDIGKIRVQIPLLHQAILHVIGDGTGNLNNVDEFGNTILHVRDPLQIVFVIKLTGCAKGNNVSDSSNPVL